MTLTRKTGAKPRAHNSTLPAPSKGLTRTASLRSSVTTEMRKPRKPLKKIGAGKLKRIARNAKYYASAEWRDVKKRTHEVDGYQCRNTVGVVTLLSFEGEEHFMGSRHDRCQHRGEIVNGKQTARGLVCDELNYQRRGDGSKGSGTHEPGVTTRTLCKDCNAQETVRLRANHAQGFNNRVRQ